MAKYKRLTFKQALEIALQNEGFKRAYDFMMTGILAGYEAEDCSNIRPKSLLFEVDGRLFRVYRTPDYFGNTYHQYTGAHEIAQLLSWGPEIWRIED